MIVRDAVRGDINAIIEIGRTMHAETDFRELGFDADKTFDLCLAHIRDVNKCLFVVESDNELIGVFGGHLSEHYFSRDRLAKDMVLYVVPERRGSRAALLLMNAFSKWAKSNNARAIVIGVSTGSDLAELAGEFCEHYGMTCIGKTYRRLCDV